MAFDKGLDKVGGRKKGTPNRYSYDMREVLKQILFDEVEKLPDLLHTLPPEKKISILLKLIPYFFPKVHPEPMDIDEPEKLPEWTFR